jgi:sigma-54 dependent transcriptional regulator, acetoin dehydrogenase operon transcriptional activator AcoR
MIYSTSYRKKLKEAWRLFVDKGELNTGVVREEIAEYWKRCKAAGIDANSQTLGAPILSEVEKQKRFAEKERLIHVSQPFLKELFHLIGHRGFAISLIDEDNLILEIMTVERFWKANKQSGLIKGNVLCNPKSAISDLVKYQGKPVQLFAEEFYCEFYHSGIGSSAPIFDENHELQAILTVVENFQNSNPISLGMVVAAAKAIENSLHLLNESEKLATSNEYLQAVVNQMPKGLMIFDKAGKLTHVSPAVQTLIGLPPQEGEEHGLIHYPPLQELLESHQEHFFKEVVLEAKRGQVRFIVSVKNIVNLRKEIIGKCLTIEEMKEIKKLVHKIIGASARYSFSDMLGKSPLIKELINQGMAASQSTSNVLVIGESGTGKEMVAQSIHNESLRRDGPFVAINCSALPIDLIESELFGYEEGSFTGASKKGRPGKFELAEEGTLFLDEVDKMPLEMQAKLLRVLEERNILRLGGNQYIPLDVRIIAASNTSLRDLIRRDLFREDLYYRLKVIQINVPPLRERREDIPFLADFFIHQKSQRLKKMIEGIEEEALAYLCSLDFPGNVRQLENIIESALHFNKFKKLQIDDIKKVADDPKPAERLEVNKASSLPKYGRRPTKMEREIILQAIEEAGGNLSRVARVLGITRTTLYRKLDRYKITV